MRMPMRLTVLAAAMLFAAPALGAIQDVRTNPYPDPADVLPPARDHAAAGGVVETWALAEALIGVHDFDGSDLAFRDAAKAAVAQGTLELRDLGLLAERLEQRRLWDEAIRVREHRVMRALGEIPPDGAATRAERELEATMVADLKAVADLQKRQLRWEEFHLARERVLDRVGAARRPAELAEYLDLLLQMDKTARALRVARLHVDLSGDVEVLRRCIDVMIRERQQSEAHRMLRLAVTSSMDYWDFRHLMLQFIEAFDPGVRWAPDRDERLLALLLGRPPEAVDHLLLGAAFHLVGERDREEQAYRDYLELGGVTPVKLRRAGDLMFGMGKTAEAFLLYQRYLADYADDPGLPAVQLRVVDCLQRTYDLKTSFHGAFNAFGYLLLDERAPHMPAGAFSVLFNDVPMQQRLAGLEDALDRYYVDMLAVDVLWNVTRRHPDSDEARQAYRRLLDYYRNYEDLDRQLEVCDLFVERYADRPEANEFRFTRAAIHASRNQEAEEEAAYQDVFEATLPPPGAPRPYEPADEDERTRVLQHDRAFRSLISLYDRHRVARFVDLVALYKAEIDLRGGDLDLVAELVRRCDEQSAYGEIESLYRDVIHTYDTMSAYDKLARHYLRMQRTREAERVYIEARKRFSSRREPYGWLSGYYRDHDRFDEAEDVLRGALEAFPDDLDWYFQLASVAYQRGGEHERCGVYVEAMGRFPHQWRFVDGYLQCLGSWEEQLVVLEREHAYIPEAQRRMMSLYGQHYLYVDRLEAAEQALRSSPDDPLLHRYLGDLYHAISAFEQSLQHYEVAAATMTDDAQLLGRVADLQRSFGQHEDAAQTYALLVGMRRDGWPSTLNHSALGVPRGVKPHGDVDYRIALGEVQAEAGHADAAVAAWRDALGADRSDPENWLELASACWDYFLFDQAARAIHEERRVLGDEHLHAKQLAAVYESKRDYPPAVTEYVEILAGGDPMVREDVRVRLVYLARNKGLDSSIRRAFSRAIRTRPHHEGLYRNYADYTARLEDWPATYATYVEARSNVRDRRFLEWLAGEFERLEQFDEAETTFADLADTYASDSSAWHAYLGYVARRYQGEEQRIARTNVLMLAHFAIPAAGFDRDLVPLLEQRGDLQGVDRVLRLRADALQGAAKMAALTELACSRVRHGDVTGAALVFDQQQSIDLDLADNPASLAGMSTLHVELLRRGADELAGRWLVWLRRELPVDGESADHWTPVARAWHEAGRSETARELLDWIQQDAPYRVDVARMLADDLLAAGDEAGMVEMFERAAKAVSKVQDNDPVIRSWRPMTSTTVAEVAPSVFGFYPVDAEPVMAGYGYNPYGEVMDAGRMSWGGYDGEAGYGYGYGYGGGYAYEGDYGYEYDGGYAAYDPGWGYESSGEDPVARGKRIRRQMRLDLRRALVEIAVTRGMKYDGVTAFERMVNDDPLNRDLLLEAWRYAAIEGYGDEFRAYYMDVHTEASRDFRWYRVMAELASHSGDLAGEAEWLEKLLRVEPHRVDVHRELVSLYVRLEREDEAVDHLERIRFLTADERGFHRDAAALAFEAGRDEEGRRHMLAAHRIEPDDASITLQLASELTAFGDHGGAAQVCRGYLDATEAAAREHLGDRRNAYRALIDAHLRAGAVGQARLDWWEAYDAHDVAFEPQFSHIYSSPGKLGTLRRDFESNQERIIDDGALAGRFRELFVREQLYREEAALRTLLLDARLLDLARKVGETYGNPDADRGADVDAEVRRRLNGLAGADHRSVHRRVAWRPVATPPGELEAEHADALRQLLRWEQRLYASVPTEPSMIREHGSVSSHPDVRNYARQFDSGHRELSRFYAERHLFLDAAAELRQIESLFGPLYNDVYAEQLDLLARQEQAGLDVTGARQERQRILKNTLYAAVAEMQSWPDGWSAKGSRAAWFGSCSLQRYMAHAARAGDDRYFMEAFGRAIARLDVDAHYGLDDDDPRERREVRDLLANVQSLARSGSEPLIVEVHRRTSTILPHDTSLHEAYLGALANRGDRDRVERAVDELIENHGRLWTYRWGVDYLRDQRDPAAALALADRAMDAFPTDVDTRLAHIELLVELSRLPEAAEETRFLVGGQTVGGYLQGAAIYAAAGFDPPLDQQRTAVANHTLHALTAGERERLFAIWAMGTGDAAALAYLAERHPRNAAAYEEMTRTALAGGHHDLALACLQRAAALFPEDPARFLALRGEIEWAAGQRERAVTTWKELAREPYAEAVQQVIDLLWERGERAKAVELAAAEVVRRDGFAPAGGGQGPSIVSWTVQRIDENRDYDLLGSLYLRITPALDDPWLVARYAGHLRDVHRPAAADEFLDASLDGLGRDARLSVLYSMAAQARREDRPAREAEALAAMVELAPTPEQAAIAAVGEFPEPSDLQWKGLLVRALAEGGQDKALAEAVSALEQNLIEGGLHDPSLAANLARVLARSGVGPSEDDVERVQAVLADRRYASPSMVAPRAELELALGRGELAVALMEPGLQRNPDARQLWDAAIELLEARGAAQQGCLLRGRQADHLLTYLPADADALLTRARADSCAGETEAALQTAALAQERNPGIHAVAVDRARFLLDDGHPQDAIEVATAVPAQASEHGQAALLAAEAHLVSGDRSAAAAAWTALYRGALFDRYGGDRLLELAAWASDPDQPQRAEAIAPALDDMSPRLRDDPRPDRLAAALYRQRSRPVEEEAALRRALTKHRHHAPTEAQLVDRLLAAHPPQTSDVDEARRRIEHVHHLDPRGCDAGRLSFRLAYAEEREDAWLGAQGVAGMSCAGEEDLRRAEQVLVQKERYLDAMKAVDRRIALQPLRAEEHLARKAEYVAAYEALAGEEVQR